MTMRSAQIAYDGTRYETDKAIASDISQRKFPSTNDEGSVFELVYVSLPVFFCLLLGYHMNFDATKGLKSSVKVGIEGVASMACRRRARFDRCQ